MDDDLKNLPVQTREATVVPASFNEADNTVEVVWTTGSRRRAYDWAAGYFDEELDVSSKAVDMTRFDAGVVQALDGHMTYGGVRNILGVAVSGEIVKGQGRAKLKLSTDPAKAGIVGDIRAGVIRSISFGYSVQKYEVTEAKARADGGTVPLFRAVKWTPHEISFVPVGADPNASTRGMGDDKTPPAGLPCEFVFTRAEAAQPTQQEPAMDEEQKRLAAEAQAKRDAETRAAAIRDEQTRSAAITELCAQHKLPDAAAAMIRDGVSMADANAKVLQLIAVRDAAGGGHLNATRIANGDQDELTTKVRGIEEAIEHRVNSRSAITDNGRQFRGMSLVEIGREMLESAGVRTRGMSRMEIASRMLTVRSGGMMTVSDFPSLLANVANKRLRMGYEENPGTYQRWARKAPSLPDFKQASVVQLSAMPDLLRTNEHGEFKYGSLSDGAEVYSLLTYGRIVPLTRQAIVNDDLRGFDRMSTGFGASAARLENRTVYAQLTANGNMADGVALFHATHGNLAASGSVIDIASLTAGRKDMRLQKGLQSEELNLAPAYLIGPAALEQVMYQYTSANYTPATAGAINEFRAGGRTSLEPIVEPILDGNSATAWYLAAQNSQVDTVEYAYLEGAEGPVIDSEVGFDIDGMSLRARLDFVAKVIDYRGLRKNPGA